MHHIDANEAYREKAWGQLHKSAASCIEQVLAATSNKNSSCTATNHPSWKQCKLDEQDMEDTGRKVGASS